MLVRKKKKKTEKEENQEIPLEESEEKSTYSPYGSSKNKTYSPMPVKIEENSLMQSEKSSVIVNSSPKWVIEYEDLKLSEKIGEGSFGIVFKGTWRRAEVAGKSPIFSNHSLKLNNSRISAKKNCKILLLK